VSLTIDGNSYTIATSYDGASRVNTVAYPSGFAVRYGYNARSFQSQLSNAATSEVYWTANGRDAELRLTRQSFGNGVGTDRVFDPNTGRLLGIQTGTGAAVQNLGFTYDSLGNLLSRTNANAAVSETFAYDVLNRLTSSKFGVSPAKTFAYDAIGNLTSKSGVGTYSYPASGQSRPHAVTSISGGVINTTFAYDANGNRLAGNGLTMVYSSFNKPVRITRGTTTVNFVHDPEQQRHKQTDPSGETIYLTDDLGSGVLVEKLTGAGGQVQWTNYLLAAGEMVGMKVERSDETADLRYFHKDHLNSIAALTNESGTAVEQLSYDAWGKRRFPNGDDDPAGSLTSQTTRGFTGQEQLDDVGLIHMNGRVYDPLTGQFGSADPTTSQPFTTQGWNRYAYASNSPLTFTDPSGYLAETPTRNTPSPTEAGPGSNTAPPPSDTGASDVSSNPGASGAPKKLVGSGTSPSLLNLTGGADGSGMMSGPGTPSGLGVSSSQGTGGIRPPATPGTPGHGGVAHGRGSGQVAHTNAQSYLNAGMSPEMMGASTIPGIGDTTGYTQQITFTCGPGARLGGCGGGGGSGAGGGGGGSGSKAPPALPAPPVRPALPAPSTSNTNFIGTPRGDVLPMKGQFTGPYPVTSPTSGKATGSFFRGPTPGAGQRRLNLRLMDAIVNKKYNYPNGYSTYTAGRQTVNPYNMQTLKPEHEWSHIPNHLPKP
jgi:RHS repeat-associated protein